MFPSTIAQNSSMLLTILREWKTVSTFSIVSPRGCCSTSKVQMNRSLERWRLTCRDSANMISQATRTAMVNLAQELGMSSVNAGPMTGNSSFTTRRSNSMNKDTRTSSTASATRSLTPNQSWISSMLESKTQTWPPTQSLKSSSSFITKINIRF